MVKALADIWSIVRLFSSNLRFTNMDDSWKVDSDMTMARGLAVTVSGHVTVPAGDSNGNGAGTVADYHETRARERRCRARSGATTAAS